MGLVSEEPSLGFHVAAFLLCPHMAFLPWTCRKISGVSSSYKHTILRLGPHSFDLFNYLLKGPISQHISPGIRAPVYDAGDGGGEEPLSPSRAAFTLDNPVHHQVKKTVFFHRDKLLKVTFLPEDAQMSICS